MSKNLLETLDEYLNETNHIIYTPECDYSAYIEANRFSNSFTLLLGGVKKGCVKIYVEDINNENALIDSISYDSDCNIQKNLTQGTGTKHLVHTALNIIIKYFPNIKYFTLLDTSHIKCDNIKETGSTNSLNLGLYFMIFNNQTW